MHFQHRKSKSAKADPKSLQTEVGRAQGPIKVRTGSDCFKFCCWDKISNKSKVRRKGLILAHSLMVQSILVWKALWVVGGWCNWSVSVLRRQREMYAGASLWWFSLLPSCSSSPFSLFSSSSAFSVSDPIWRNDVTSIRRKSPRLNVSRNIFIVTEMRFHGDSNRVRLEFPPHYLLTHACCQVTVHLRLAQMTIPTLQSWHYSHLLSDPSGW